MVNITKIGIKMYQWCYYGRFDILTFCNFMKYLDISTIYLTFDITNALPNIP